MSIFSLASGIVAVTAPAHYFPDQACRLSKTDHRIVTKLDAALPLRTPCGVAHACSRGKLDALFELLHGFRGHDVVTHCMVQASLRPLISAVINITLRIMRISDVLWISVIESCGLSKLLGSSCEW